MVKLELSASLDPSPLIREKICVSLVSESTADKVAIVELAETLSEIVIPIFIDDCIIALQDIDSSRINDFQQIYNI